MPLQESTTQDLVNKSALYLYTVSFVLFLFAGVYKNTPVSDSIPVNLTLVFMAISGLAALYLVFANVVALQRTGVATTIAFAAFAGYALLSLLWSPGGVYAADKTLNLVTTVAWSLVGCAIIVASDRDRMRQFFHATIVLALIALFVTGINTFLNSGEDYGANYIVLGRVIGFGTIIAVYRFQEAESSSASLVYAAFALISICGLLIGGSRAALGTTVLVIAAMWLINVAPSRNIRSTLAPATIFAVVAAIVGGVVIVLGWIPRTLLRITTVSTAPGSSLGKRFGYWTDSIIAFSGRPLFGHGFGSWPIVTGAPEARWPHNILLEILTELGLTGLVLFAMLIAVPLFYKRNHLISAQLLLLSLFTFALLNSFISGDLSANRYLFATVGLLAGRSVKNSLPKSRFL